VIPLPIGYVRRPSGDVILDPDEQARHVVRLVFGTFTRLRTLNAVPRYLVGHQVQLPVRVHSGPAKGEIEWWRPNRGRCRSCCTTRSMPGTTPTAALRDRLGN
jgi:hypothetical protein